jgi:hypothetical protein
VAQAFYLLALKAPTNVEKKVLEIKEELFRRHGLASALALPVGIPVFCLPCPPEVGDLRRRIREAVGRRAPVFSTAAVTEFEGCLFWELEPAETLLELGQACRRLLSPAVPFSAEAAAPGQESLKAVPFTAGRGFFLADLEGRSPPSVEVTSQPVPASLRFPAQAAVLIRITVLVPQPPGNHRPAASAEPGAAPEGEPCPGGAQPAGPWWQALYWEEILRLPLRKPA